MVLAENGRYRSFICLLTQHPEDGTLVYEGNDPKAATHPKVHQPYLYTIMIRSE